MKKLPLISIIISTKNEERIIKQCLDSIANQDYPKDLFEIIVVDNYSADNTKKIAKEYTKHIYDYGPERSPQRNFGCQKSKGSWLLFLDADFVLPKSLLKECVNSVNTNKKLVALYIPLRWSGKNWIIRARGFEREFYDGTSLDAVRFINKNAFIKSGMFNEKLYAGEDWDINIKLSKMGQFDIVKSQIFHYEDENINLYDYINKSIYYSKNIKQYQKINSNNINTKKQFNFTYRYLLVFIENGKYQKILKKPILFVEMYLLKIISGFVYLFF